MLSCAPQAASAVTPEIDGEVDLDLVHQKETLTNRAPFPDRTATNVLSMKRITDRDCPRFG